MSDFGTGIRDSTNFEKYIPSSSILSTIGVNLEEIALSTLLLVSPLDFGKVIWPLEEFEFLALVECFLKELILSSP